MKINLMDKLTRTLLSGLFRAYELGRQISITYALNKKTAKVSSLPAALVVLTGGYYTLLFSSVNTILE